MKTLPVLATLSLALLLAACPSAAAPPAPTLQTSEPPPAAAPADSPGASGCTKIWVDDDAVLQSHSMYEDVSFDRKQHQITQKVYTWPAPRTVTLSDAEFRGLDGYASSLCLPAVANEPPPPPGGPYDVKVTGRSGEKRLGVRGNTGGSYYLLSAAQSDALLTKIRSLSPSQRGCLHLRPATASITGKLLRNKRGDDAPHPGEEYPLVLLDSPVCVVDDKLGDQDPGKLTAGSIELVTDAQHSVAPAMFDRRVTVSGKLSPAAKKTDLVMFVESVQEAK